MDNKDLDALKDNKQILYIYYITSIFACLGTELCKAKNIRRLCTTNKLKKI